MLNDNAILLIAVEADSFFQHAYVSRQPKRREHDNSQHDYYLAPHMGMRSANTYCRGRAFVVAIEPKGRHS